MSKVSQPKGIITNPGVSGVGMAVPMTQPNEQLTEIKKALETDYITFSEVNKYIEWLRSLLEDNKRLLVRIAELEDKAGDYFDGR